MASSYPSSIDSFTRQTGTGNLGADNGLTHKDYHDNAFDGIEAVQATLGANPQGSYATVVERLDATDALEAYLASSVSKSSDTDDTDTAHSLGVSLEANTNYHWRLEAQFSVITSTTSGDMKCRFTGPAGANKTVTGFVLPTGLANLASEETSIANMRLISNTGSNISYNIGVPGSAYGVLPVPVVLHGVITVAGTAGTLRFQWAQSSSDSNPLQFIVGSRLRAWEIT